ncbi:MAG: transglutaminase-like cysteine peptidase [Pseudomonadota bacterium]
MPHAAFESALCFRARAPRPSLRAWRIAKRAVRASALAAAMVVGSAPLVEAGSHIVPVKAVDAPAGFHGVCDRYVWACAAGSGAGAVNERSLMDVAREVNLTMNRRYPEIADDRQYDTAEFWALPTARGGDCEDFALAKKQALLERGVPTERLMIATVLDRSQQAHAVLVLRTAAGDMVLDNLTNRILPWEETGYFFLRMQDPNAPATWNAVLTGGPGVQMAALSG